ARIEPDSARIRFSVTDTGVGLSESDRLRLFEPFAQAVDARPPEPGTGLGLAISRRLVELMDGELQVDSTLGRGSTFAFAVPLEVLALDAAPASTPARPIVGYDGPRRRVVVVDDVTVNRSLLTDLLQPLGFVVTGWADPREALDAIVADPPDLVILDLRMPGLDGIELARRIRAADIRQPRLVLMSASVLSFDPQIAFDAGCDDFLPKPFRQDDLLDRLARTLKLTWARLPENQNSEIDAPLPNQAIPTPPEKRSDLLAEL